MFKLASYTNFSTTYNLYYEEEGNPEKKFSHVDFQRDILVRSACFSHFYNDCDRRSFPIINCKLEIFLNTDYEYVKSQAQNNICKLPINKIRTYLRELKNSVYFKFSTRNFLFKDRYKDEQKGYVIKLTSIQDTFDIYLLTNCIRYLYEEPYTNTIEEVFDTYFKFKKECPKLSLLTFLTSIYNIRNGYTGGHTFSMYNDHVFDVFYEKSDRKNLTFDEIKNKEFKDIKINKVTFNQYCVNNNKEAFISGLENIGNQLINYINSEKNE